jgi:hypothetical protein
MSRTRLLLFFVILGVTVILLGSYCFAEDIPFGINNPYDESAPKEKAYLIKPYMNDLGVKWVNENVFRKRVEPRPGIYDWKEPDFFVKDSLKDLDIVFNINPKTNWQVKGSIRVGKKDYIPGGDIDGESFKLYKTFLKELIKRYKDRVHRWEVFNEPGIECKDIPENYVKLLKISYLTIKEVDPNATVCLGGLMLTRLSINFLKDILPLLSSNHPVVGKENDKHKNYFDSFDLHYFSFYNEYRNIYTKENKIITVDEFLNNFKKHGFLEGKMITARAGATYSGGDSAEYKGRSLKYQSETQQAGYLVRRAIYLLSRGVRSAWSQIREREEWEGRKKDFNCYMGLVYNGVPKGDKYDKGDGVKKLSYWTYKFLVEKIKETDWKNISTLHDGTSSDHLYLYKLIKKTGQPLYIAWWDYFDKKEPGKTKTMTIDVGNIESVKVTETIPNAEWGKDLKESNYPNFFKTEVKKVSNGKVSFDLGEKPVFVEIEGKTITKEFINKTPLSVIPACLESFLKKDAGQASMTEYLFACDFTYGLISI